MAENQELMIDRAASEVSEVRREDAELDGLPDGLAPLSTIHDKIASELLELAERQVAEVRKKLGAHSSKPRVARVASLFDSKIKAAPEVDEDVDRLMHSAGLMAQVAACDGTFDHALAAGFNTFDRSSIQVGASVQTAYDNWTMAVRIYKSELRAAGSVAEAHIESAIHTTTAVEYGLRRRGKPQVDHYTRSSKVGEALLDYERAMQKAGSDLSSAYGKLINELYGAVNSLAVAEAGLIAVTQNAYKVFWTSVQSAMNQSRL